MTGAAFLKPYVPGPARIPVKYGLFSVLDFRGSSDQRWEGNGVQFQSFDGGFDLGVVGAEQTPQSGTVGLPLDFSTSDDMDEAGVFSVYGQQVITPAAGWTQDIASARAEAFLFALEERTVERVLAGTIAAGFSPKLSDASVIDTVTSMKYAVASLERYLAENYGSQGIIHMSRADAVIGLSTDATLVTQGNGLFTKLGTPVAAGQGYPDGTAWCTSSMIAYRSDVYHDSTIPYDLLDKEQNDLYAIAQRTYSVGWESAALAAVTIGDSPA